MYDKSTTSVTKRISFAKRAKVFADLQRYSLEKSGFVIDDIMFDFIK